MEGKGSTVLNILLEMLLLVAALEKPFLALSMQRLNI